MYVPNSSAMDVAAGGGGPSARVLPSIVTGQPEAILAYARQILDQAARLADFLDQLERTRQQLRQVWQSGSASDNAQTKLANLLTSFNQIIQLAESAAQQLETVAGRVRTAQCGYAAVVHAVNPVVAALLSNPYTHGAARALAHAATGALETFVDGIGEVIDLAEAANILQLVQELLSVAGTIEQLAGGGAGDGGAVGSMGGPVRAPEPVPSVASPAGQRVVAAGGQGSSGEHGSPGGLRLAP